MIALTATLSIPLWGALKARAGGDTVIHLECSPIGSESPVSRVTFYESYSYYQKLNHQRRINIEFNSGEVSESSVAFERARPENRKLLLKDTDKNDAITLADLKIVASDTTSSPSREKLKGLIDLTSLRLEVKGLFECSQLTIVGDEE